VIDLYLLELIFQRTEGGNVIPVLVRRNKNMQMIFGRGPNVRDDIRQFDPRGRGAERPAVNQHVLFLMTDIEGHQKTVT
jgi:hypothetical protein